MLLRAPDYLPEARERYHRVMDAPVRMADGSTQSAARLAQRFFESEYGQSMLDQPYRYDANFGYDRDDMIFDNGLDHCPIGHQRELPYHFGKLLDQEDADKTVLSAISDCDRGVLALAMFKHDNGESTHDSLITAGFTVVGDIPAGNKRQIDRENEAKIRNHFDAKFLSDVHPDTLAQMEAIISHEDKTLLHDYFEAAHAAQTFETSNRAHYRLNEEVWHRVGAVIDVTIDNKESARLSGLLGISRVVYSRSFDGLKEYSYFGYIDNLVRETDALRNPSHRLIN
jgi:hypothetical protein